MTITMFDSIDVTQLPKSAAAYAGYVDGRWVTFPVLKRLFPNAHLLAITVTASVNAECLDVENGDATIAQAPGWVLRQMARRVYRPVVYTQASNLNALEAFMTSRGIHRSSYRIWSAHYGVSEHICGPKTCGFGLSSADGTQWTPVSGGLNLDQSLLADSFFNHRPKPKPKPILNPTGDDGIMILNAGDDYSVALPDHCTKLRFGMPVTKAAEVEVSFHGTSVHDTVAGTYADGARSANIPSGCLLAHVTRTDTGTEPVTMVFA